MKKGTAGTSLGGGIIRTRRPKRQRNNTPCPSCGAGKGQSCFEPVPGRGLKTLTRTHRALAAAKRPGGATANGVDRAYKAAAELGPIVPVSPTLVRSDGSPRLDSGQVYVMRTGTVFHPAWCAIVGANWDDDPEGLLLIAADTIGGRRECKSCEEPLTN